MHVLGITTRHDDHHLAGIHPVTRAMWLEQSVGDAKQNRVDQYLVGESLRALSQTRESFRFFSPEIVDRFMFSLWADLSRFCSRVKLIFQASHNVTSQHVVHDHATVAGKNF